MTKEKLYELFDGAELLPTNIVMSWLDSFFSQNVITQKGENRHPYADVLHEWVEGAEIEWRYTNKDKWSLSKHPEDIEYRIKPKEPVYEWQWVYGLRGIDSRGAHISPHLTEDEFKQYLNDRNSAYGYEDYFYYAIEETKRERKQCKMIVKQKKKEESENV